MKNRLIALSLYATAMGYLEAAVVVYLRNQFYPSGFYVSSVTNFSPFIYQVELIREVATIIMLLSVAYLAYRELKYKIITFLWLFAIWDLTYYLFLKLILNWPVSFKTLDYLYLIPFPWVAPVWFPVIISSLVLVATTYMLARKK